MLEQNGDLSSALNGPAHAVDAEMRSTLHTLHVEFQDFFGVQPKRLDRRFVLNLSEHTYLPKVFSTPLLSRLTQGIIFIDR